MEDIDYTITEEMAVETRKGIEEIQQYLDLIRHVIIRNSHDKNELYAVNITRDDELVFRAREARCGAWSASEDLQKVWVYLGRYITPIKETVDKIGVIEQDGLTEEDAICIRKKIIEITQCLNIVRNAILYHGHDSNNTYSNTVPLNEDLAYRAREARVGAWNAIEDLHKVWVYLERYIGE